MNDLFVHQLQDIYYAAKQLVKALTWGVPMSASNQPKADIRIGYSLETTADHTIAAAIFSADISTGKLVLAHGTTGKIEASTTRRPWTALTRP